MIFELPQLLSEYVVEPKILFREGLLFSIV